MTDAELTEFAEKCAAIERHLKLVERMRPASLQFLEPESETTAATLFHLLQALQIGLHLASSWCVRSGLGAPSSYRDAFEKLERAGNVPT